MTRESLACPRSQALPGNALPWRLGLRLWSLCLPRGQRGRASRQCVPRQSLGTRVVLLLCVFSVLSCQQVNNSGADKSLSATITTTGGVEMVLVPAGTFEMGSKRGKEDATAVHKVALDAFLMDKCEVTQAEYEKQGLPNPSHFKGPDLPAEQITWAQAAAYCNARSRAEDLKPCYNEDTAACDFDADGYRLPTEAEWEYACRAGSDSDYGFGSEVRKLGDYAWFADNSNKKTHPVGEKKPNAWGLFDMHGN